MRTTACILALTLAGPAGASPADAVRQANADCQRLPPAVRPLVRYFSLYAVPAAERKGAIAALNFWCNSLSREAELVQVARVSDDLVRVNVRDYLWDRAVWERLADVDPYFHYQPLEDTFEEVVEEYGYWTNEQGRVISRTDPTWTPRARWTKTRTEKVKKPVHRKGIAVPAPWLPLPEWNELALVTKSNAPIVRADWWIYQTGISLDRKAGYYDWLGVGRKEADFQQLIGADVKLAQKVRKEVAAVVSVSEVTLNNRSMERFGTITGSYWRTHDFRTNTFRQNVVRFLDGSTEPPKGDASEQYGTLANGLFAFWLQDKDGNRQDTAPDFIAGDGASKNPDRRVHVGMSCVRCHVEGIRPIDDWIRSVHKQPPPGEKGVPLSDEDYDRFKRLQQLYLSDLEGRIKDDQTAYSKALLRANGLTPAENAKAFAKTYSGYADARLLPADLARELGVPLEKLEAALKAQYKVDPVLAAALAKPPVAIRREHWEEVFETMQRYLGSK